MSSCSKRRTKAPRSARGRRNGGFPSSSAAIVADLDDVLIQILSYLPIKTLLRSKRVSKRWLSLITNPDFSQRIIKPKHPLPISGFFLHAPPPRGIEYSFVSLDDDVDDDAINQRISLSLPLWFTDHPTEMIIMQSTNGLLLCRCACATSQFNTNYYVYNPTTKQNTLLPQIIDDDLGLSLAFDPCKSPHYKVFCLRRSIKNSSFSDSDGHLYHIEVYSSNDGTWRRVFSAPSYTINFKAFDESVFWNGAVHWFGSHSSDFLSFDINQEQIKILPLPNLVDEEEAQPPEFWTLRFLDESRGNLYYFEVNDQSSSTFPVYEMEKNSLSWSVKYSVDLEPLAAAFPEMIRTQDFTNRRLYTFSVIGIVKEETDAESYILLHIQNKAVKYSFADKTFKKLCGFEPSLYDVPQYQFRGFQRSFQFIASLANV